MITIKIADIKVNIGMALAITNFTSGTVCSLGGSGFDSLYIPYFQYFSQQLKLINYKGVPVLFQGSFGSTMRLVRQIYQVSYHTKSLRHY